MNMLQLCRNSHFSFSKTDTYFFKDKSMFPDEVGRLGVTIVVQNLSGSVTPSLHGTIAVQASRAAFTGRLQLPRFRVDRLFSS